MKSVSWSFLGNCIVVEPVPLAPMDASRESRPGNLPDDPRFGKTNFFTLQWKEKRKIESVEASAGLEWIELLLRVTCVIPLRNAIYLDRGV